MESNDDFYIGTKEDQNRKQKFKKPSKIKIPNTDNDDYENVDDVEDDQTTTYPPVADRSIIYIKNIPRHFNPTVLRKLISQYGEISAIRMLQSKKTCRFSGSAYVEMP